MRRAVLTAATLLLVAGCGGARPASQSPVRPVTSPAALLEPTPDPSPQPTRVPSPMALIPQVEPTPASTPVPARVPVAPGRALPRPVDTRTPRPAPPAAAPPAPARAQPARLVSDNWSGYVAQGSFWQVGGAWTEPSVTCTATTAESVFWVGLGGYPDYPLYQAGSGAFCRNGIPIHVLWYELLTPGTTSPLVALVQISPGDRISASIDLRAGGGGGIVRLVDESTGYGRDVSFTPQADTLGTAEWIAEATSHGGTVSTLADFGSVDVTGCSANLGAAGLAAWPATQLIELTLTDHSGGRAAPGAVNPTPGGGDFTVSYLGS